MVEFTLDTDIGSDVDDLMALAMVLGSAEMSLRAVTTVYGDTLLRARIVRRAYAVAGRPAPPVAAGARETRSGQQVWWAGHEGALLPDLASEPVDETLDATAVLRASTVVAAVGPLTNVADALDGLAGYACYGPIAGTIGSFDLYWIVVDPAWQGRGLGRRLMGAVEAAVRCTGGCRLYIDTSTSAAYAPTRAFYTRCGYAIAAELPDFYSPGDGKVIFVRALA